MEKVIHQLKTWPEYYQKVKSGEKTFEVRKNDRDFKAGDILHLKEWKPNGFSSVNPSELVGEYTGEELAVEVTYVFQTKPEDIGFIGIGSGVAVMSICLTPPPSSGEIKSAEIIKAGQNAMIRAYERSEPFDLIQPADLMHKFNLDEKIATEIYKYVQGKYHSQFTGGRGEVKSNKEHGSDTPVYHTISAKHGMDVFTCKDCGKSITEKYCEPTPNKEDADKLELLAKWFDIRDNYRPAAFNEVQQDLRRIASNLRKGVEWESESEIEKWIEENIEKPRFQSSASGLVTDFYQWLRSRIEGEK